MNAFLKNPCVSAQKCMDKGYKDERCNFFKKKKEAPNCINLTSQLFHHSDRYIIMVF